MKDFFSILRTYAWPYKGYLIGSLVFNLLSAVLNVFSFMSLMPMLQLLFGINKGTYHFIEWGAQDTSFKDTLINNLYYWTQQLMERYGPSRTLLYIGLFLIVSTLLKTFCYFASSGVMVSSGVTVGRTTERTAKLPSSSNSAMISKLPANASPHSLSQRAARKARMKSQPTKPVRSIPTTGL